MSDTWPNDENRFWNELMIQHCRTWRKPSNGMTAYCLRELLGEPISDELAAIQRKVRQAELFGRGEEFEEIQSWDWILEKQFGKPAKVRIIEGGD